MNAKDRELLGRLMDVTAKPPKPRVGQPIEVQREYLKELELIVENLRPLLVHFSDASRSEEDLDDFEWFIRQLEERRAVFRSRY